MSFQKGHPFYKGGEKGWFKKGHIPSCKGTAKIANKNCQYCSKEFQSPFWQKLKFCSYECSGKFHRAEKIKIICKQCKKEFFVYPSEQDRTFCSIKCCGKNNKIIMKGRIPWNKGLKKYNEKEKHPQWKGGVTWDKEYWNKKRRDKYNIDSEYRIKRLGDNHIRKTIGGELSIQTIQQVYEDNIKRFGTLTCYLCFKPIEFRQDCLEHKIPLSRGGTNVRDNLDIAHRSCNSKKNTKTEEEYQNLEVKNVSRLVTSRSKS
jgi:5-methylcytosine-specific restriction endonuclease McrA